MTKDNARYKRILLKISGEALLGSETFGLDLDVVRKIASEVAQVHALGVEVALVIGGGNVFRGATDSQTTIERATGDYMGMIATVINALAFQSALEKLEVPTRVQTAIQMSQIAEPYIRRKAIRHLEKSRIVIFAAGTGNPFFTTDTAAALRAMEIGAEVLMKATKVDGVYSDDPMKVPDAKKYDKLTFEEVLQKKLGVMDSTAIALCMDNNMSIMVFNMNKEGNMLKAASGEAVGTMVEGDSG